MKTVSELIEELKAFPPDVRVVTSGYDGGYRDCGSLEIIKIVLDVNDAWYYGPHDTPWDGKHSYYKTHPGKERVDAVLFNSA